MKTIFWENSKIVDVGGGFTAIYNMYPTSEGTVLKVFIYKGIHNDDEVLITSILSRTNDEAYLFNAASKTLNNREHLENVWNMHRNRKK